MSLFNPQSQLRIMLYTVHFLNRDFLFLPRYSEPRFPSPSLLWHCLARIDLGQGESHLAPHPFLQGRPKSQFKSSPTSLTGPSDVQQSNSSGHLTVGSEHTPSAPSPVVENSLFTVQAEAFSPVPATALIRCPKTLLLGGTVEVQSTTGNFWCPAPKKGRAPCFQNYPTCLGCYHTSSRLTHSLVSSSSATPEIWCMSSSAVKKKLHNTGTDRNLTLYRAPSNHSLVAAETLHRVLKCCPM